MGFAERRKDALKERAEYAKTPQGRFDQLTKDIDSWMNIIDKKLIDAYWSPDSFYGKGIQVKLEDGRRVNVAKLPDIRYNSPPYIIGILNGDYEEWYRFDESNKGRTEVLMRSAHRPLWQGLKLTEERVSEFEQLIKEVVVQALELPERQPTWWERVTSWLD